MVCCMRQSCSDAYLDLHRCLQHRPRQHLHLFQGPNDIESDEKAVIFLALIREEARLQSLTRSARVHESSGPARCCIVRKETHRAREGGGEHDGLAVGPDVVHDAHDLWLKPHVEHAVRFVHDLRIQHLFVSNDRIDELEGVRSLMSLQVVQKCRHDGSTEGSLKPSELTNVWIAGSGTVDRRTR